MFSISFWKYHNQIESKLLNIIWLINCKFSSLTQHSSMHFLFECFLLCNGYKESGLHFSKVEMAGCASGKHCLWHKFNWCVASGFRLLDTGNVIWWQWYTGPHDSYSSQLLNNVLFSTSLLLILDLQPVFFQVVGERALCATFSSVWSHMLVYMVSAAVDTL